jgi:tetratricopeptide (TPR) repeat protein
MSRYYLDYAREHRMDYAGLELEWGNFNAGLRLAYQQHEWQAVSDYITALQQPWEMRGRYSDARQAYRLASEAAQARGDEKGYADALREWGRACIEQGDYDEACEHLQQSLDLSKRIEYQAGIANAQFDLARIDLEQSDFAGARTRLEQSQQIRRELEDTLGIAATLHDLANVEYFCRNFDLAASYARDALTIEQASDAKRDMIKTLRLLAQSALQSEDSLQLAQEYGALAIKYCQELGDQGELAATLRSMAEISRRQHELDEAKKYADQSLSLLRLLGDRKSQARVLYTSSLISIDKYQAGGARSDWEAAQRAATASLNLCIELDDRLGMMYLLTQLGDIYKSSHDEIRAREFWSKANDIALSLNQQFEAEIRARLQPSPA